MLEENREMENSLREVSSVPHKLREHSQHPGVRHPRVTSQRFEPYVRYRRHGGFIWKSNVTYFLEWFPTIGFLRISWSGLLQTTRS
jgi:hypothetical protein